jgi:hypothetical protein
MELMEDFVEKQPAGYAVDRRFSDILYVPETSVFRLESQSITWKMEDGTDQTLKLLLGNTYILPSGFKIHLEKPVGSRAWRLIGTRQEGTLCHKPCTVSGGGKSEISKPITDAIIYGSVYVSDFERDFDQVEALAERDYSDRFRDPALRGKDKRSLLSPLRTLGSVIKLLTPRLEYSEAYNEWLNSIPQHVKELVLVVKRFWVPEWDVKFKKYFSVDIINGIPANELRVGHVKLITQFLRVGYDTKGAWRTFGLRKDYQPAMKVQMEDDITASITVPRRLLGPLDGQIDLPSVKFVHNVEHRLFQRPDDAIIRGYDGVSESDFAAGRNFFSNYEPISRNQTQDILEDAIGFYRFSAPMQALLRQVANEPEARPGYVVSTAFPRVVDGKPTKNPRYLQTRPDLAEPRLRYLAEVGARMARRLQPNQAVHFPVHAILAGRRNNPAEGKVRSLACYGPIHHMELPELFMEFISSMTGKSPSTTGAGSEGALTKGPFNALLPIHDLNAALVSFCVSGYPGFLTSAGCLGPKVRVDHDISLLVPEVWSRMGPEERMPEFLKKHGYLEKCEDFTHDTKCVKASRLGYRITPKFAKTFLGRVFNHPHAVLTEEMMRPEKQNLDEFADAIANVIETHRRVATHYFLDGSIDLACPPIRALLYIMRDDVYEGKGVDHPDIRALFDPDTVMKSDWYQDRLKARHRQEIRLWRRHVDYLEKFLNRPSYGTEAARLAIHDRLSGARVTLARIQSPQHLETLQGTLGTDPTLVG